MGHQGERAKLDLEYVELVRKEDRVLKELGKLYTDGLVSFLGIPGRVTECLDTNITGINTERQLDLLLRLDNGSLVDVEFQSTNDNEEKDLRRFRYYNAAIGLNYNTDVFSYVLYSSACGTNMKGILHRGSSTFKPNIIKLAEMDVNYTLAEIEDELNSSGYLSEYSKVRLVLLSGSIKDNNELVPNMKRINRVIEESGDSIAVSTLFSLLLSKFLDSKVLNKLKEELSKMDIINIIATEREREGEIRGEKRGELIGSLRTKIDIVNTMVDSGLHAFEEALKIAKLSKEEYYTYSDTNIKEKDITTSTKQSTQENGISSFSEML